MNYPYQGKNYYPKSILISVGILLGFLLISYFIIIGNRLEEFGTGGIIVNYGTSEEGMGDNYMSVDEPSMDPDANQTRPDKVVPNTSPAEVASQQTSDKEIVTQDMEDAPEVVTKKKESNTTPVATPEKKESKPTINPNALYTGKKNNASGTGDGTGSTPGNQGSTEGNNLTPDYGEGGSGFGDSKLENRGFVTRPNIEDNGQLSGRVAVEITVNKDGAVISARAGVRGSTLTDAVLWEKCERAVMGARLNPLENGPPTQRGIVMFVFKVR